MRYALKYAYPGTLGYIPPAGYVFLIDKFGFYLTDADGKFLVVPA
jgi:hypothetical protein